MNPLEFAKLPAHATAAQAESPPCLIVNPRSFLVAGGRLGSQAIALASRYRADIIVADRPEQIAAGLDKALARGRRRVFVLSGDGTMQAIVDHLARLPVGSPTPLLLVLAGGRTNLTAADLGGRKAVLKKLESALMRWGRDPIEECRVQHRHTLVVEQPPERPQHGFFMAGALIDSHIRNCQSYRESGSGDLRHGHLGTAWCLLKSAVPSLRGRKPFVCPDLDVEAPGLGHLRGPARVLIATTLAHDESLFNPYADRGSGAVRVTAVAARAPGFWRSLPRLLTGRFTAEMETGHGYLSGRCETLTVRGLATLSLDGQGFELDPARPVHIRAGPRIGFLTP